MEAYLAHIAPDGSRRCWSISPALRNWQRNLERLLEEKNRPDWPDWPMTSESILLLSSGGSGVGRRRTMPQPGLTSQANCGKL